MAKLSDAYKTINKDNFPPRMEIAFSGTVLPTITAEKQWSCVWFRPSESVLCVM